MKAVRIVIALLALIGLSACYTSSSPLIGDDAVTPFEEITFTGRGDNSDPARFVRKDNGYVTQAEDETVTLHLKPVAGDYYVAQLAGPGNDGGMQYLYGYLRIDTTASIAETWKTIGTAADVREGLSECDDVICIDSLDAYIAYAQEAVAAGEAPAATFDIVVK